MPPKTTHIPDESQVDDRGREFIRARHRFPANTMGFLLAPALWMLHFIAMYSLQGAGCALGYNEIRLLGTDALHLALGAVTVLTAGALVATGVASFHAWQRLLRDLENEQRAVPGHATFLAYGALLHAGLFLIATLWGGIPVMLLETCDTLGNT